MSNKNKNRRDPQRIPDEVQEFAKFSFKKFKKETKGYYKNKTKQLEAYFETMAEGFQYVTEFFVRYGHLKDEKIVEYTRRALLFLRDETFCKCMIKMFNKDELDVENYELLPILIRKVLEEETKAAHQLKVEHPDEPIPSHDNLVKLSTLILKKKLKKLEKKGIDRKLAFDLLSVVPCKKAMTISRAYRARAIFAILYQYSKDMKIDFDTIVNKIIGEEYIGFIIVHALLEKKEKFSDLTDGQKAFHTAVTSWCIDKMENDLDSDEIAAILRNYVNARKKDEAMNRDGNRRYPLSTLSEVDYPHVTKAITAFINRNEADKKYL